MYLTVALCIYIVFFLYKTAIHKHVLVPFLNKGLQYACICGLVALSRWSQKPAKQETLKLISFTMHFILFNKPTYC